MRIDCEKVGPLGTNCYLMYKASVGKGILFDCGGKAAAIEKMVLDNGVTVEYIILTHGHFDHMMAVAECAEKYNTKIIMHQDDVEWIDILKSGQYKPIYATTFKRFEPDILIEQDCKMELCGLELEFICTPGHSKGSMCIICQDVIISGDTLFREEIGRCDFYGGDYDKMLQSLKKISSLTGEYIILPGHGESTTMRHELQCNRYIEEARSI